MADPNTAKNRKYRKYFRYFRYFRNFRIFEWLIENDFSKFSHFRMLIEIDTFAGFFRIFEHFENIIFGGNPNTYISG